MGNLQTNRALEAFVKKAGASEFAPDSISDLVSWYKSDTNVTTVLNSGELRVTDWADVDGNYPLEQDYTNASPRLIDATHGFASNGTIPDLQNGYPYIESAQNNYVTGLTPPLTSPFTMVFVTRYNRTTGSAYAYRFTVGGKPYVDGIPGASESLRTHYGYKVVWGTNYTTSSTTLTIGTGAHTVVVADDLGWTTGYMNLQADNDNCMIGTITSYDAGTKTLVLNITTIDGSGTFSHWDVRGVSASYNYTNYPNSTRWDTLINVYDGASSKSVVNGVDNGSGTLPTPIKHTGLKLIFSNTLEVITYNKALDTDEIEELNTYLTDKYAETSFVDRWSMYFDGVDEYVTTGATVTGTDFTLSYWVNANGSYTAWQRQHPVSIRPSNNVSNQSIGYLYAKGVTNGPLYPSFQGYDGETGTDYSVWSALDLDFAGAGWHHITWTFNNTNQNIYCYVDGVVQTFTHYSSGATTSFLIGHTAGPTILTYSEVNIGAQWTPAEFFDGNIDDVAIWDTVLDADTITSIYNLGDPNDLTLPASYTAGSGVDKSGDLVGYWLMGDGATYNGGLALPYTIPDESSNSNAGSFTNGSLINAKMDTP